MYKCDLQKGGFHLVFYSNFAPLRLIVLKKSLPSMISKGKKIFFSIHGGSLSLCKCRRTRIKGPTGQIWPTGRSLPISAVACSCTVNH